jgi:thiamine biosynthesis lipoprotein
VDRCVTQLRGDGIRRALLNFGESSLYALGAPVGTHGWEVTLRDLDGEHAFGTVTLRDMALSVSAVFGHERRVGPRRIGHIVDPRSGLPLTSPALAVVVASSATDAEAFSKALLVDGTVRLAGPAEATATGAVLVKPGRVTRVGRIAFKPFAGARLIAAAAEPLR